MGTCQCSLLVLEMVSHLTFVALAFLVVAVVMVMADIQAQNQMIPLLPLMTVELIELELFVVDLFELLVLVELELLV